MCNKAIDLKKLSYGFLMSKTFNIFLSNHKTFFSSRSESLVFTIHFFSHFVSNCLMVFYVFSSLLKSLLNIFKSLQVIFKSLVSLFLVYQVIMKSSILSSLCFASQDLKSLSFWAGPLWTERKNVLSFIIFKKCVFS